MYRTTVARVGSGRSGAVRVPSDIPQSNSICCMCGSSRAVGAGRHAIRCGSGGLAQQLDHALQRGRLEPRIGDEVEDPRLLRHHPRRHLELPTGGIEHPDLTLRAPGAQHHYQIPSVQRVEPVPDANR